MLINKGNADNYFANQSICCYVAKGTSGEGAGGAQHGPQMFGAPLFPLSLPCPKYDIRREDTQVSFILPDRLHLSILVSKKKMPN